MGFIDLIQALKAPTPNADKTATVLKYLGWGCVGGGVWNKHHRHLELG